MQLPLGSHIHLIAACGTAMGSLAGMLREQGYRVTGSDSHVYPPMSTMLEKLGIDVRAGFSADHLVPAPDLVVIGNAISRGNPEAEAVLSRRIPYLSLPEVLRDFFIRDKRSVVVTGTHGKTTTTALIAHLFTACDLDPSFLVAGVPQNFDRSYRLGQGAHFIVEGDEYDSAFFAKWAKFFYYLPDVLIVNNIEFDHADIYQDLAEIVKAFRQLVNMVPQNGLILANGTDPNIADLLPNAPAPVETFGLEEGAFWRATNLRASAEGTRFTLCRAGREVGAFDLPMSGDYNVCNALASLAAGFHAGLTADDSHAALASFAGVKRRQEQLGLIDDVLLIDDFAHHPTAVAHTLEGLHRSHPERRLIAVFEPASATNARALFESRYVEAFALADAFVATAVPRPERARDDEPFSPERLVERLRDTGKPAHYLPDVESMAAFLATEARPGDLVVFMSNGGFGGLQQKLCAALTARARCVD